MRIEYRVKAVERYIITRFEDEPNGTGSVVERGFFTSPHVANEVASAMCLMEVERHKGQPDLITAVELIDR